MLHLGEELKCPAAQPYHGSLCFDSDVNPTGSVQTVGLIPTNGQSEFRHSLDRSADSLEI